MSVNGDAALLAEIAQGSESALRRLYESQSRRLYGVALRLLGRPDHAADAVQDAFVQIWQNAAAYTPKRGSADAWLIAITRYRALDIRRRYRNEMPQETMGDLADTAPTADSTISDLALRRCLEALEASHRHCVVLAYVEGLSHPEIAGRLNAPLGTIKSWVRRGLLALRDCLA